MIFMLFRPISTRGDIAQLINSSTVPSDHRQDNIIMAKFTYFNFIRRLNVRKKQKKYVRGIGRKRKFIKILLTSLSRRYRGKISQNSQTDTFRRIEAAIFLRI